MDPMSQVISGLPAGPANPGTPQAPDNSSFMQPQPGMFSGPQQQQQPQAPQIPPMQTMPSYQQVAPQAPAYGQPAPQYPQGAPQQPQQFVPGAMPMAPIVPQFPSQQQNDQIPAWAQELAQSVQQLQNPTGQAGGGSGAAFDPTKPWSSENRPKSWDEMRQANETLATTKAREIVTQTLQEQQQQAVQQQQAEQQASVQIDQTFNRLRLQGALPQVANPNDPNDPGKLAERELLGYTLAMGGKSAEDMVYAAPGLLQRHSTGEYYDVKTGQMARRGSQSPAAMAPMAGASPMMSSYTSQAGPTQSQLARGSSDLGSLMAMGMQQIQ